MDPIYPEAHQSYEEMVDSVLNSPPATATPGNPRQCPNCARTFSRRQERDRHISTYLPHSMYCPVPDCSWRGNRVDSFKKHWERQDHLQYREPYGLNPGRELFEIFNAQELVGQIKAGHISVDDAAIVATVLVFEKATQLQKQSMFDNLWGYKLK